MRIQSPQTIPHWIDGGEVTSADLDTIAVDNPASGTEVARVELANSTLIDNAVRSARKAAAQWATTSLSQRTKIIFEFRHIFASRSDELAAVVTAEHGKVLDDAGGEVARALENIEFACGIGQHLKGDFSSQVSNGIDVATFRQPLGVVAGITPFNFPAMVPAWMFPTAIACGNTFIAKPSERDPSASIIMAKWLTEAGLPDGVFNVVHGDKTAVDALLNHSGIDAISFVGSTPVARHIYETGTRNGKRVQALGGAKNHMVVMPDADIDIAADAAVSAAYGSAGERCMAISAIVAVGDIADNLVDGIAKRIPQIQIGDGTEPGVELGPLITAEHRDRVASYVSGAADAGAKVVVDGRDASLPADGFFLGPSLIDHVTPDMDCHRDEIFGPVLVVVRVDSYEEALELINSNPYGNGTAIFTRDGGTTRRFQAEVQAGMVGVNVAIPVPVAYHSFGGWKASLFGDAHAYGPESVRFYTRAKAVTTRWPDAASSMVDLGFPTTA